jgi:hypothetical protein
MSTNYYALTDCCEHCERPAKRVHIGQWPSGLRGYKGTPWEDGPGQGLRTWGEWKDYLFSDPNMQVEDEYGKRFNVHNFIELWETMPLATRRRQYDWLVKHQKEPVVGTIDFALEPDGYTVTFSEFS